MLIMARSLVRIVRWGVQVSEDVMPLIAAPSVPRAVGYACAQCALTYSNRIRLPDPFSISSARHDSPASGFNREGSAGARCVHTSASHSLKLIPWLMGLESRGRHLPKRPGAGCDVDGIASSLMARRLIYAGGASTWQSNTSMI